VPTATLSPGIKTPIKENNPGLYKHFTGCLNRTGKGQGRFLNPDAVSLCKGGKMGGKKKGSAQKKTKKTPMPKEKTKTQERVQTGIMEFDQLIDGGFLPNQNILLAGAPGTGKSTFAAQFVYNGAKNGEHGVYVSTQETKEKFYANMKKFGMDFEELEKKGTARFVEQKLTSNETFDIDEVVKAVMQINAKRIVYDSITMFGTKYPKENEKITNISECMRGLASKGAVVLWLTGKKCEEDEKFDPILSINDGIIEFGNITSKVESTRTITVVKLRGTEHDNRTHPMKITEKGLCVSKEEVI